MVELVQRKTIDEDGTEIAVFLDRSDEQGRKDRRGHERAVVQECFGILLADENVELDHVESGAPYLKGYPELEVSLSHSKNWYAIQLSKKKSVGIDVQVFRPDGLYKGRAYFVNEREENTIELSDKNLHLIWSMKEAIYKFRKGEVELYKESITLVKIGENELVAEVEGGELKCGFELTEDFVLVYTL